MKLYKELHELVKLEIELKQTIDKLEKLANDANELCELPFIYNRIHDSREELITAFNCTADIVKGTLGKIEKDLKGSTND